MELVVVVGIVLCLLVAIGASAVLLAPSRRRLPPQRDPRSPLGPGTPDRDDETISARPPGSAVGTLEPTADAGLAPDDRLDLDLAEPPVEAPEPVSGRLVRLRERLSRSESTLGRGLLTLLARDRLDDDTWDEVEEVLITADVGVAPTQELVARLRTRVQVLGTRSAQDVRDLLRAELVAAVDMSADRSLSVARHDGRPAVVLVVGVNGTGKTTTVGKLARLLVAADKDVVLGAADTFRAAAADQLQTWGERVGVLTVRGPENGDPASVAYDAVRHGIEAEADVVLVDTAGRLHTKSGLMDELGKVKRVIEKHGPVDEVLLVIDATTGQNGLVQARVFADVVDVTGIVLTKLDGTAKGGIVIAVQRELGVPVKLIGLGEGADDLAPFEPEAFVDAILG